MTSHELNLDVTQSLLDAPEHGHNRLHPEIPPALTVARGDTVTVDVRDGFDAQLRPGSSTADVLRLDPWRGHPLTGPIAIEGVEPGDVLEITVVAIEPAPLGYSALIPGVGLLGDEFSEPFFVVWELAGGFAASEALPGVRVRGRPFLGVVAVAPSHALLRQATERERALAREGRIVLLPDERAAVPAGGRPAREGLRTLPPRENGGNLDVRHVCAGSTISLGVQVAGALCSVGDPHFAQGDGESSGVAIEVGARVTLAFDVGAGPPPGLPLVHFEPDARPAATRCVATIGIPVDRSGRNGYLDVRLAAQAALREMIAYLTRERGLTPQQAYVLVSVACDLQISEIVNVPNAVVSAVLPLDVFDNER